MGRPVALQFTTETTEYTEKIMTNRPKANEKDPKWLKAMLIRQACGCMQADCQAHGSYVAEDVVLVELLRLEDAEQYVLKAQQYDRRVELVDDKGGYDTRRAEPITELKINWPR